MLSLPKTVISSLSLGFACWFKYQPEVSKPILWAELIGCLVAWWFMVIVTVLLLLALCVEPFSRIGNFLLPQYIDVVITDALWEKIDWIVVWHLIPFLGLFAFALIARLILRQHAFTTFTESLVSTVIYLAVIFYLYFFFSIEDFIINAPIVMPWLLYRFGYISRFVHYFKSHQPLPPVSSISVNKYIAGTVIMDAVFLFLIFFH